jgi:hypothetical protein
VKVAEGEMTEHEHARARVHAFDHGTQRFDEPRELRHGQPDIQLVGHAHGSDRLGDALAERPQPPSPRTVIREDRVAQARHGREDGGQRVEHWLVPGELDQQRGTRPGERHCLAAARSGQCKAGRIDQLDGFEFG